MLAEVGSIRNLWITSPASFHYTTIPNSVCDPRQKLSTNVCQNIYIFIPLAKLWKGEHNSSFNIWLLRSTTFAVALYGSESWATKLADKSRLVSFEMWCFVHRILKIPWTEMKTNAWVLVEMAQFLLPSQKSSHNRTVGSHQAKHRSSWLLSVALENFKLSWQHLPYLYMLWFTLCSDQS